jgi:hypothetical protein
MVEETTHRAQEQYTSKPHDGLQVRKREPQQTRDKSCSVAAGGWHSLQEQQLKDTHATALLHENRPQAPVA